MTAEEVEALKELLQTASIEPSTEATVADLRNRSIDSLLGGELIVVMTPWPRLYVWCPTGTGTDNGVGIVLPSSLGSTSSGRWYLVDRGGLFTYSLTYSGVFAFDPPSIADGAIVAQGFSSPDVELGDFVIPAFSLDLQGVLLYAHVSSNGNIRAVFHNETGAPVDLGSGSMIFLVIKK